jgi:hypothetical protein
MVIDWGATNPASGYLLTVIFFAGSDVVAHADTVTLPGTTVETTDVTAPGFEPAFVIFASTRSAVNDTTATNFGISFGIAANDGADSNFSLNLSGGHVQGFSQNAVLAINDTMHQNLFNDLTFGGHYVDTYDADGFTVRCIRDGGNTSPYLAIGFGGAVDIWLGDISTPTSTGNDAEAGPGFVPQALIGGFNYTSSGFQGGVSPTNDQASVYSGGIGIATPTAEYSNVVTSEDAADTMNTQSLSDDVFANVPPNTGGTIQDVVCTGPAGAGSFDAGGFTLNYSAVDTVDSHPFFVLAIGESSLPATDNFNRAGPALGGNWASAASLGLPTIDTNQVVGQGGSERAAYWINNTPNNDQYAKITWSNPGDAATEHGPAVRVSNGDMVYSAVSQNDAIIYWWNSGARTQIGSTYSGIPGVDSVWTLEAEGSDFRLYEGAILRVSGSNGSAPSSGYGGMYIYNDSGRMDDFEVGNLGGDNKLPSRILRSARQDQSRLIAALQL